LGALAGGGVLAPREAKAFTGRILEIFELIKRREVGLRPEWAPEPIPEVKFGMVIDLGKCIGCRRCSYACKRENNVPDASSPPYITLFETEAVTGVSRMDHPTEKPGAGTTMMYTKLRKDKWYMPVQCNHCDDAHTRLLTALS
jgi:molybdopterin-containing oxidoreductase family iron-sulfur binding subunit